MTSSGSVLISGTQTRSVHALPTIATLFVAGREVARAVVVTIIKAPGTDTITVPPRATVVIVVEVILWLMFIVVDKHIPKRLSYT